MKPIILSTLRLFVLALPILVVAATPAKAYENRPKDDSVTLSLSAEDWITTQTARVVLSVEAAVTQKTAGKMRKTMNKTVNSVVTADWRLTNFYRNQDKTGMERWSATYEARLPEVVLSGLNEQAIKKSKAGMQISVQNIDFTPTLQEREAAKTALRSKIYKMAIKQKDQLNKDFPNRNFRISGIRFSGARHHSPRGGARLMKSSSFAESAPLPSMEKSEKLRISANIILAAQPDTPTAK